MRSLARRAGYYTREEDALGRVIERYGNAVLIDAGTKVAEASMKAADDWSQKFAAEVATKMRAELKKKGLNPI